jgi:hypothetical protein
MFHGEIVRKLGLITLLLLPTIAYANVVWPALYLETRLFSWWAILCGLVVEFFFVFKLLTPHPKQAAIHVTLANTASAILGIVLIPALGLGYEFSPGQFINDLLDTGTFNPFTWVITFLIACSVNVVIEGLIYKHVFKLNFLIKSKMFLWFMLANSISVGIALASVFIYPVQA